MSLAHFATQVQAFGFTLDEVDAWCMRVNRPTTDQMSPAQRQRVLVWLSDTANRARVRRDLEKKP